MPMPAPTTETPDVVVDDLEANTAALVQYLPRLQWRARTLLADRAAAADLVQDTVEKALRALPRLRPGSNVAAWLERLLSNTFIDRWRRAERQGEAVSFDLVEVPAVIEQPEPDWLEITDAEVHAAVDRLPAKLAAVFRLHAFGSVPYEEISKRLGVREGTVGTRLRRARARLRDMLASVEVARAA